MVALNALSPSRANDFVSCPLKFRFRTIDKLPEPPSAAAFKGTLVHSVLENLFDLPPHERTAQTARSLITPSFEALQEKKSDDIAELFPDERDRMKLFADAGELVDRYFTLELPDKLEPAHREQFVQTKLDNGLILRGFIDRVDVAPGGEVRLVDYKTGKEPKPQYSREAEFQMRFYGVLKHRTDGTLAHTLQLMYLGSGSIKAMRPQMTDISRTEDEILGIWQDIARAAMTNTWRPRKSPLCGWCHFKPICPAWGGTPPEAPEITAIAGQ